MRIALVMDDMPVRSNGTSSTALRYADALREQGHEVICVAFGADDPDSFDVPEHPRRDSGCRGARFPLRAA